MNRIIGIGMDMIETERIREAMVKNPDRFPARIFTELEAGYCEARKNKYQHYAARFAAKEAFMKALGTGWAKGVSFRQVEVRNEPSGKPGLILHGATEAIFRSSGAKRAFLSLSHTREYAVAQVILTD